MTQTDFNHIVESLGALSPEQMRQLRRELDDKLASATKQSVGPAQGSLGAMRDAADELDAIVEQAMKNREERPWRLSPGE
jgi:uncharacterized protein with von Willebrand factor type A (vWA) domain